MINKTQIFPLILMILDFASSFACFINGDVKKGIYWLSAMILSVTVTF